MSKNISEAIQKYFMSTYSDDNSKHSDLTEDEKALYGWVNAKLKRKGFEVNTIEDFDDGICLLTLIETLLGKEKHGKSEGKMSCWRNIIHALDTTNFRTSWLNGKYDDRRSTINEILWSLMVHFEMRKLSDKRTPVDLEKASTGLLQWLNQKIPNENITNFTSCWQDGMALCALYNSISMHLIPQSYRQQSMTPEMRCRLAMQASQDRLKIPQLVSFQSIISGNVSKKAMLTYIALFASADRKLRKGLPLNKSLASSIKSKSSIDISTTGLMNGHSKYETQSIDIIPGSRKQGKCLAYGSGLRYGQVGRRSEFVVQLGGGTRSELSVTIECKPYNQQQTPYKPNLKIKPISEDSYKVQYTPVRPGSYSVSIFYGGAHIQNSPFRISIGENSLRKTNSLDDICTKLDSSLEDGKSNLIKANAKYKSTSDIRFKNTISDQYVVDIDIDSKDLDFEPYLTLEDGDTAVGSGLICGEVGILGTFLVYTPRENKGPLSVCVTCPAMSIPVPNVRTTKEPTCYVHRVSYLPTEPGVYEIEIKWGESLIKGSPYWLAVVETKDRPTCFLEEIQYRKLPVHLPIDGKNAVVYYAVTSQNTEGQKGKKLLEKILKKELPEYLISPIPIDVAMTKQQRQTIFELAGTRKLPMLFIDGQFIGDYNEIIGYHRRGELVSHLQKTVWNDNGDMINESDLSFTNQSVKRLTISKNKSSSNKMTTSTPNLTVSSPKETSKKTSSKKTLSSSKTTSQTSTKTTSLPVDEENITEERHDDKLKEFDSNNNLISSSPTNSVKATMKYHYVQKSQTYRVTSPI